MNKTQLFNIAAWTFIVIGVILLIWKIFGNSPAEFNILTALVTGLLFKVMAISNDLTELKVSFKHLALDFKEHTGNKKVHK
ncbi:hypothetical protein HYW19_04235 [Candidatus Woesearchaeota archaeon]|nr:hypothetical protein [Candidatus Woesearchaeota archaeon]